MEKTGPSGAQNVFHRVFYSPTYAPNTQTGSSTAYTDFLGGGTLPNTLETYTYTWTCPAGMYFASLAMYQLGTAYLYYTSVVAQDYAGVGEWGADVTLTNTAAGIVGQGALATLSQVTTTEIADSAVNTVNIVANAVNSQITFSSTSQITAVASSTTVLATSTLGTNGGYVKVRCTMYCCGTTAGQYAFPTFQLWKGAFGSTQMAFDGNAFVPQTLVAGGLASITLEGVDASPGLAQQYTVTATCGAYPVTCDAITFICENAKV